MIDLLFLIISFLILAASRQILIELLFKIAGNKRATTFYFLLFFPGIIIHELAHFFVATALLVPTGEISLFPEEERVGHIEIAKTDPFRTTIIGLAPMIVGTAAILSIFLIPLNVDPARLELNSLIALLQKPLNWLWLYLVLVINNTMFTSPSDRRSWFGFLVFLGLIIFAIYLFGLLPLVIASMFSYLIAAAKLITLAYLLTFLVNLIFITPLFIFQKIIGR